MNIINDSEIVIYRRSDLKDKSKKIKDIYLQDFKGISNLYSSDMYIFVDVDFTSKILKSRFCDNGLILNDNRKKESFNIFNFLKRL